MNAAFVLRGIVEIQTGPASASLAKFDAQLKGTAAAAETSMGRVASSTNKAAAAGARMEATGRSISKVGRSLALASAPMALFGAASVKMALDFKRQMGLVATDAGGMAKEVKHLEHSVLGLARASQFGPTQLAESLFHVESSGYRSAKAMKVLNESQKLATVGNSDLQTTTYALVSATKALYGESLTNVNRTAAELNGIVAHGDMRLEELTSAMATGVIPKAKSMGLNLRDVGAAMDVMTTRGMPAQRAAYALGFTMQKLIPSTKKAADGFKEIGLGEETLVKAAQGPGGYVHALEVLQDHLDQLPTEARQTKQIEEMFGGGRMTAGLLIDLQNLGEMKKIYGELGKEVGKYNRHVKEAEEQPLVKMKKAWSSIEASMTEIGGDLLPIVVPGFEHIVELADSIMHGFTAMPQGLQSAVVEAGLFTIALSGGLIVIGKVATGIGVIRTAMEGLAATNLVTSLLGGAGELRAALSLALGGEMGGLTMVGSDMAGGLMGGLTRALPMAAAAAGIGNIVISATHNDWEKAGFKAGGALVGGIAGSFLGPEGTMLGVGAGSALGGLLEPLFTSAKHLTPLQARLQDTAHRTAIAFEKQHDAARKLARAEHLLQAEQRHSKRTSEAVHTAEARLASDRKVFGSDSLRVRHDELLLAEAKAKNNTATKRLNDLQQLTGNRLKVYRYETTHAVAVDKERIQALHESKGSLERRLHAEERARVPLVKQMETRKQLARVEEASEKRVQGLTKILEQAAVRVGPEYAKSLNNMNLAQVQFGKHLAGLKAQASTAVGGVAHSAQDLEQAWLTMVTTSDRNTTTWNKATIAGIRSIMGEVSAASQSLGVSRVEFHIHGQKPKGHQLGGFTVPGTGSGDTFHTAIPFGSFVMNREATAAFGFQGGGHVPVVLEPRERVFMPHEVEAIGAGNLAAMNASVSRFQKGGRLGPEPALSGPSGAMRSLGQAAIHSVYQGAQHYLAKHRPQMGDLAGLNVPTGPIEQMAREMVLRVWGKSQWAPFAAIEMQEAGWNPHAQNPTSTAYGLAQNLHPATYPAAGRPGSNAPMLDQAKAQLQWMVNYIHGRYGTPAAAWAHEQSAGWYQRGGLVGLQKGGSPSDPRRKWAGWDALGHYHGAQRFAKGGSPKTPKVGSASDAVAWAMHHIGSGDQWGYPGEWCGAFIAADMQAQNLPVPPGFASAASWANYGSALGRNNVQAGAILDYGSAHVALAVNSSKQIQGNDIHGQVGTSGIGGIIGGSPLTAVRWPPYSTKPGAGSPVSEKVPAVFEHARTKSLSFPSIPKNLPGVNREINHWQRELRVYRHAASLADGAPATKRAIEANIAKIENQLRQLRGARTKLHREIARKHFSGRLSKALGKVTGKEQDIEAARQAYESASQYAEQVVDLEPTEPILSSTATNAQREAAEKTYVSAYSNYIESQERPAYSSVLGKAAEWRNTIIGAEHFATNKEIAWEGGVRRTRMEIDSIQRYAENVAKHLADWQASKHKHKGKKMPDSLRAELETRKDLLEKLPSLRFEERELMKVLGEGRESFYGGEPFGILKPVNPPNPPLAGSGSFEEALRDVQGIHWPDQHEVLAAAQIAPPRQAGRFGGAIWDVQTSIEELGLKIQQAGANLGSGGSGGGEGEGKTERETLLEELLLRKNQGTAVGIAQGKVLSDFNNAYPFMGSFAKGGVALVGEQGPEIAAFPTGTRIHNASETSQMMAPTVAVHVYEGEKRAEVEVNGELVDAITHHHRFAQGVQKAARAGRGVGLATPGGARR